MPPAMPARGFLIGFSQLVLDDLLLGRYGFLTQ
jgi:hypothetical protein